jgi:poly-beta-1,6-N-acetyl-D-glucosamine N-deacetylase
MSGRTREAVAAGRRAAVGLIGWSLVRAGVAERTRRDVMASRGVSCVSFHDPDPELLGRCIRWLLAHGYHFVSEADVVDFSRAGRAPGPGCVWLSLDDGWRSNLRLMPVFEQYGVPVTIFLATEAVGQTGVFWWTCVYDHRSELPGALRRHPLGIWDIPEGRRRAIVEPLVKRHLGEYERQALTVEEVHDLARHPLVSFGSHTVRHPSLPACDPAQLEEELRASRATIESWTQDRVWSFAYPKDRSDPRQREAVARAGYALAVTVGERVYNPGSDDAFFVPRLVVGEDSAFSANICKMVGAWRRYIRMLPRA